MMFFTTQPLWVSGILLVGVTTLLAMVGPIVVRRTISLERLSTNNEIAGFKFATVGVLYAVLLSFTIIVVWEKFSEAEIDVVQEAGAGATIYRLSNGIGAEQGAALRDQVTNYLKVALADEWPAMALGGSSPSVTRALDHVYTALLGFNPSDGRGTALLTEILHQLDLVTQARRTRVVLASGIVPGVIWLVLLAGAMVTVGFTFFFGTRNIGAQILMTGGLSVLVFSGLLIIVAIDHPFAGSVKVGPEPLSAVLEDFADASRP